MDQPYLFLRFYSLCTIWDVLQAELTVAERGPVAVLVFCTVYTVAYGLGILVKVTKLKKSWDVLFYDACKALYYQIAFYDSAC